MAIETYTQQLERVQAAISKIETGGQTVDWEGKRLTRGDLATLYARERELRTLAAREQSGGGMGVRFGVPC